MRTRARACSAQSAARKVQRSVTDRTQLRVGVLVVGFLVQPNRNVHDIRSVSHIRVGGADRTADRAVKVGAEGVGRTTDLGGADPPLNTSASAYDRAAPPPQLGVGASGLAQQGHATGEQPSWRNDDPPGREPRGGDRRGSASEHDQDPEQAPTSRDRASAARTAGTRLPAGILARSPLRKETLFAGIRGGNGTSADGTSGGDVNRLTRNVHIRSRARAPETPHGFTLRFMPQPAWH